MNWVLLHPQATEMLGFIPDFLSENDPRLVKEQIHANYSHGGGWNPLPKWKRVGGMKIQYPGDSPLFPIAYTKLRDETIAVYECGWVMVIAPDESFEVARLD